MLEKVFSGNMFGHDHKCVNVRSCFSSVYEESKADEGMY